MYRRAVDDSLNDVGPAIGWVSQVSTEADLSEDTRFGIELCIEEALANLIMHGQSPSGNKDIAIVFSADRFRAKVQILDRCAPFDVVNADLPQSGSFDDSREGGRGLRLLRSFASEITYETVGEENILTMVFGAGSTDDPG
jgi:anti-sigma regulatory factor (Ser/Thr protein kinase)